MAKTKRAPKSVPTAPAHEGNGKKTRGPSENRYVVGRLSEGVEGKTVLDVYSQVQPTVGKARKLRTLMREMQMEKANGASIIRIRVVPEKESSNVADE